MRHETIMEKYSRGRRGAPAKGVGRVTGARVQIPLSPLFLFFRNREIELLQSGMFHKNKKMLDKEREFHYYE